LLAILLFLGIALQYAHKSDISVAIVCMVNHTALTNGTNATHFENNFISLDSPVCQFQNASSNKDPVCFFQTKSYVLEGELPTMLKTLPKLRKIYGSRNSIFLVH
jgi:hypothetical protein